VWVWVYTQEREARDTEEEWGVGDAHDDGEEISAEDLSVPADLCSSIHLKAAEFTEVFFFLRLFLFSVFFFLSKVSLPSSLFFFSQFLVVPPFISPLDVYVHVYV